MTLAGLFTVLSLYPWNFNANGVYTTGSYSTGPSYTSQAAYISMDRRSKDYFTVGYERIRIEDDTVYEQDNVFVRSGFYVKPALQPSFHAGRIASNSVESGWLVGGKLYGDLPWVGYEAAYTFSKIHGWNTALDGSRLTRNLATEGVVQWDFGVLRALGNLTLNANVSTTAVDGDVHAMTSLEFLFHYKQKLFLTGSYGFGEARYATDVDYLVVDNNQDVVNWNYRTKVSYRFTPNFNINLGYARKSYSPAEDITFLGNYTAQFVVFGAGIRL